MGIRLAVVCCLLSTVLCGCSHREEPTNKTVLRFSVLGAKQEADLANALVKGFEAKCRRSEHLRNPQIKINVEPVAGMGYDIKLVMQSAAGTLPDVVFLADSLVPTFTKYQVVRDLRPFIRQDPEFPINDIYPQMMKTGTDKKGRVFMLPRELGVVVMFYNRALFRKAGLPDPTPDWTRKDFLRMARKLTLRDKDGRVTQYGFSASYNWCGVYAPWVASEGGRVVTRDGARASFSSPESLKGLEDLVRLVTVEKVAMPPNRSITIPGVDPFAAGKIAMQPQVFPQVPFYRATMKDGDWDVQVMPAGTMRRVTNMGAAGYGMSTNTKHPKEAWEFLKFIVSPEGQRILAASGSGIPCLKSLAKDPCWRTPSLHLREGPIRLSRSEGGHPALNYDAFVNSVEFGMGWEDFLILTRPEVSDAVTQAFEKSFLGTPVGEAFREADGKINKILAEKSE